MTVFMIRNAEGRYWRTKSGSGWYPQKDAKIYKLRPHAVAAISQANRQQRYNGGEEGMAKAEIVEFHLMEAY